MPWVAAAAVPIRCSAERARKRNRKNVSTATTPVAISVQNAAGARAAVDRENHDMNTNALKSA